MPHGAYSSTCSTFRLLLALALILCVSARRHSYANEEEGEGQVQMLKCCCKMEPCTRDAEGKIVLSKTGEMHLERTQYNGAKMCCKRKEISGTCNSWFTKYKFDATRSGKAAYCEASDADIEASAWPDTTPGPKFNYSKGSGFKELKTDQGFVDFGGFQQVDPNKQNRGYDSGWQELSAEVQNDRLSKRPPPPPQKPPQKLLGRITEISPPLKCKNGGGGTCDYQPSFGTCRCSGGTNRCCDAACNVEITPDGYCGPCC